MADRVVQDDISIREMASREGVDGINSASAEVQYLCKGSDDPIVCRDALFAQVFYDIFTYDGLRLESMARERRGNEQWAFTLTYGLLPATGAYTVAIDTTGGLVRTTEAFAQQSYPAAGETATPYGTSLNVQDGKAIGVDRIIPALKITITARIAQAYVASPIAYAKLVASVTGFTNNATYLTFDTGELLFGGATGQIVTEEPTLAYTFIASKNLVGASIGPISGITKAGHDYLWVDYKSLQDVGNTNRASMLARAAYVGRVYGAADMNVLKIGVP
jgi:hypothetical protein